MNTSYKLRIIALTSILVLLINAVFVLPVRADGSTPPPPAPTNASASNNSTTSNSLSKVPRGTDVIVLDGSGHSVVLASQKAAHLIASGDPIWCPLGVAPKSGAGGCSPAYPGFSAGGLSTWLALNDATFANKNGVIWIEGSYDSSVNDAGMTALRLDGSFLPNMALHSLTLIGGWKGIPGSAATDPSHPSVFDGPSVRIVNWHGAITISDIVVKNASVNSYEPDALSVQTDKGGITLNRVQVIDNYAGLLGGAHLDTHLPALGLPRPVTVNDSIFNNNYYDGLYIQSNGAVKIRNLDADNNGSGIVTALGANINNNFNNLNQPVTLTGTNTFVGNYGSGLVIFSSGAVSLNNITSFRNDNLSGNGTGVFIENNFDTTPSLVKLTGTNLMDYSAYSGLNVVSNGNIYLNNVTSSWNGNDGVHLDNCLYGGSACSAFGKSVTLTGTNSFNNNGFGSGGDGLDLVSDGAISISQVTSLYNQADGAYLDNCNSNGITCTTLLPYNITITNASTFNSNGSDGLEIHTTGSVSLKNITASLNGGLGLFISNDQHLLLPRPVTIGGTNLFLNNTNDGLAIFSYGAIKLNNITAIDNGQTGLNGWGAFLANEGYDIGLGGATVIARMPVTLTGINTFNHNYNDGLHISSVGAISLSNVSASNNGRGLTLVNSDSWYPNFGPLTNYTANVTLTGFSFTTYNLNEGLVISSKGSVSAANLNAQFNGNHGAQIQAFGALIPQNVTLSGANTFVSNGFSSGTGSGLLVVNSGKITISNLSAISNRMDGANLDNYTHKFPGKFLGVTFTGFNTFQKNLGTNGLYIDTDGSVTLSHINADQNTNFGVDVVASRNITVMCGTALFNSVGFDLIAGATLTLVGVHAYYNSTNEILFGAGLIHNTYACP